MTPDRDRIGVLVVRIWLDGPEGPPRARITHTFDLNSCEQVSNGAVSADEILTAVRDWVDAFLAGGS